LFKSIIVAVSQFTNERCPQKVTLGLQTSSSNLLASMLRRSRLRAICRDPGYL
jgi:hypothetical protein